MSEPRLTGAAFAGLANQAWPTRASMLKEFDSKPPPSAAADDRGSLIARFRGFIAAITTINEW
ncbi:hypothetical protein [Enterovirga sp.]|uniref:hypothetical protein n=1 Tax=Enterovirga sp. TaxID=2026350 RepID=UPI002C0F558F|nr:hypothetical protein [Enterovirga sp.]HMO28496.1 hypothetical protein [Enterovirga sp.]